MIEPVLLPCFKPADWEGAPASVGRRLTVGDLESKYLPWLALGYDRPHTFEFLRRDTLETLGRSEEEAEMEAFANLRARPASWERTAVKLGDTADLELVIAIDDYFAAEKLLDPEFMCAGGALLETDALAVGIPCRGVLMATRGKQDTKMLGAFAAAVSAQFHHPSSPPITPAVFALMRGEVVGMLQGGEELGSGGEGREPGDEGEPQDFYLGALVVQDRTTGLEAVHICAGGANIETLGRAIEGAFHDTIERHAHRQEFGGSIRVVVFGGMTPPAVREQLAALEAHLQGTLREMGLTTPAGHRVTVGFDYQDDHEA